MIRPPGPGGDEDDEEEEEEGGSFGSVEVELCFFADATRCGRASLVTL